MRYIVTVRGTLKGTEAEAERVHNEAVDRLSPGGRALGSTAHTAYLNLQDRRQFLAVDEWGSLEGLQKFMSDPKAAEEIGRLFDGPPDITVWAEAGWRGY